MYRENQSFWFSLYELCSGRTRVSGSHSTNYVQGDELCKGEPEFLFLTLRIMYRETNYVKENQSFWFSLYELCTRRTRVSGSHSTNYVQGDELCKGEPEFLVLTLRIPVLL